MSTISIAMTTYCGEKYIEKQLNSLLNQTRKADEVIILDDLSSDNTAEIITNFIKINNLDNWYFSVNSKNLGFVENFYQAIKKTNGDIVFLCDQDDIWHDNKLEIMEKLFQENPKALAINSSFEFIDGKDEKLNPYVKPDTSNHNLIFHSTEDGELFEISEIEILKGNISPGCTMAFTKGLRDYYFEHASLLLPHDFELNIYAAKIGKLYFYNKELISYRIHENNAIGLDTSGEKNQAKFNGTENERIKVYNQQTKYVEFFNKFYDSKDEKIKEYIKHFIAYIDLRQKVLIEHNPFYAIKMLSHLKYLKPNISTRVLFGDLLYSLHLQNFFES